MDLQVATSSRWDRAHSLAAALVLAMALIHIYVLRWEGRVWWCSCGRWNPISLDVNSLHNSQHLLDPYSLTHVLHGILFFGVLWLARRDISLPWRAVIAVAIEFAWEIAENSSFIVNRYRAATVSFGYTGDSVANSLGDVASLMTGFWLAKKLGLWWSVAVFIATELLLLWWIRDNLLLNVMMLLWPIDAIRRWQAGA